LETSQTVCPRSATVAAFNIIPFLAVCCCCKLLRLRVPISVLTALSGCTLHAVAHRLTKIPGSDEFLEQLHLVLYKRRGTASSRKKDTRAFSGWTFAGDSKVPACGPPLA